jgi:hypothetical protein
LALLLEVFAFNLPHWLSLAAGEELTASPDKVSLTGVTWNEALRQYDMTDPHGTIDFSGFDTTVKTIWVDPVFSESNRRQPIKIHYDDLGAADRNTGTFDMIDGVERGHYAVPSAMGHITRVAVEFDSDDSVMSIRRS